MEHTHTFSAGTAGSFREKRLLSFRNLPEAAKQASEQHDKEVDKNDEQKANERIMKAALDLAGLPGATVAAAGLIRNKEAEKQNVRKERLEKALERVAQIVDFVKNGNSGVEAYLDELSNEEYRNMNNEDRMKIYTKLNTDLKDFDQKVLEVGGKLELRAFTSEDLADKKVQEMVKNLKLHFDLVPDPFGSGVNRWIGEINAHYKDLSPTMKEGVRTVLNVVLGKKDAKVVEDAGVLKVVEVLPAPKPPKKPKPAPKPGPEKPFELDGTSAEWVRVILANLKDGKMDEVKKAVKALGEKLLTLRGPDQDKMIAEINKRLADGGKGEYEVKRGDKGVLVLEKKALGEKLTAPEYRSKFIQFLHDLLKLLTEWKDDRKTFDDKKLIADQQNFDKMYKLQEEQTNLLRQQTDLQKRVGELDTQSKKLEADLKKSGPDKDAVQKQLDQVRAQKIQAEKDLEATKNKLKDTNSKLTDTEKKLEEEKKRSSELEKKLRDLAEQAAKLNVKVEVEEKDGKKFIKISTEGPNAAKLFADLEKSLQGVAYKIETDKNKVKKIVIESSDRVIQQINITINNNSAPAAVPPPKNDGPEKLPKTKEPSGGTTAPPAAAPRKAGNVPVGE